MKKLIFRIILIIIIFKYVFKFHNTKYLVKIDYNNTKNKYLKLIYRYILLNKY